jgi:L-ascorbate metabolism protein UlaG (beta-lactamase superfamily)
MRLTKLGHACVRLEKDGAVLVIDPGAFSEPDAALAGASAILVTHEHMDHFVPDRLNAAMAADPALTLWTNVAVASQLTDFGERVHAVAHGDTFSVAGFGVHVYGTDHAAIHQDIPIAANIGFMVDGEVFHPGDALTVPEDPVSTLLLPVSGPWLKLGEIIDYGRTVAPRRGYAIHDALLSEIGRQLTRNWIGMAAGDSGATFSLLEPGTTIDL